MIRRKLVGCIAAGIAAAGMSLSVSAAEALTKPSKITLDEAGVLVVDGKKVFPLTLTIVPGPDAKAPNGKQAYAEFADAGVTFMRSGKPDWIQMPPPASKPAKDGAKGETNSATPKAKADAPRHPVFKDETIEAEKKMQAAAAAGGMRCCPWLGWDLSLIKPGDNEMEQKLTEVINMFKDSPGMGLWKGADEPDWGNLQNAKQHTPEEVIHTAKIIRENDPDHPIWLVQAPRGSVERMKRYVPGWDVGGIDIYPISYPPGVHTELANKDISMVGDWTRWMKEVAGKKPFWMTLQIAFSGVVKSTQTLRFPTFPEQRFMAYQAIINGARGLVYFGGSLQQTLNDRDKEYGFNWTYFDKVMRPLFDEVGPKSPILPALLAPDSKIKLSLKSENPPPRPKANKTEEMKGAVQPAKQYTQDISPDDVSGVEYVVREVGNDIYVLACKREGPTIRVRFSGLPTNLTSVTNTNKLANAEAKASAVTPGGSVIFEEPRTVEAKDGSFTDWFGPNEVHVYKFTSK